MIRLIVGLGNPGSQYEATRHNAGAWFVDQVAARQELTFKDESRFKAEIARGSVGDENLWLLKPYNYMNLSGESLAPFARYYRIEATEILVAHDDLDLPAGVVRLKRGGGHGGHNGLRDIFTHLGTQDFVRLRVGIGRPKGQRSTESYVLSSPSADERVLIDEGLAAAMKQFRAITGGKLDRAMNTLNRREPPKPKAADEQKQAEE